MVKSRGINVCAVSQLDAQRLPEYSTAHDVSTSGAVVACYIPIYSGSQIWFEYSIEGPHPPNAAYFFKMFMNGQVVTSWAKDCTSKHDYHGKVVYSLHVIKGDRNGERAFMQNSFAFSSSTNKTSPNTRDDCIEIRVHRVSKRRRIRQMALDAPIPKQLQAHEQSTLKLVGGGAIELGRRARRYQYLLLDPQDEPYSTFRFYCRTQQYLERHQILDVDQSLSPTSPGSSNSNYFDVNASPQSTQLAEDIIEALSRSSKHSDIDEQNENVLPTMKIADDSHPEVCLPYSPAFSVLEDSDEDLLSGLSRATQPLYALRASSPTQHKHIPISPTKESSPLLPEGLETGIAEPLLTAPNTRDQDDFGHASQSVMNIRPLSPRKLALKGRSASHQRSKLTLDGTAFISHQ